MQGIEDCLFAIRSAVNIGQAQANVENIDAVLPPVRTSSESTVLDEVASKARIAAAGVAIPKAVTGDRATVEKAAGSIGYPLVLKAVDAGVAHKSDAGAVAVGLADEAALADALTRMAGLSDQFLLEEMIGPSVAELIIGVNRDASFGLSLLIGSGGTLVELVNDTVSLLLPARRVDIENALSSLKVKALLDGYRGGHKGNVAAVIDAIEAITRYAVENNQNLIELDVNPLLVTPASAVAVDALIRESE
jgi:acetyl-CoA synthetase